MSEIERESSPMAGPGNQLAVVVLTRNRRDELLRTLGHLASLPERPPVIVVDNASTDGTSAAVQRALPSARVIQAGGNLGAAGRNLGVQATDAPYVAFCDDDTWWEPGSLAGAAAALDACASLALVMARVLVGPENREDPICREILESPLPRTLEPPGAPLVGFLAGASVVRRKAFLEAGGFRSGMGIGGEEDWLAATLLSNGWKMRYLPQLSLYHYPSPNRHAERRRRQMLINTLAFAWLRRPLSSAVRKTCRLTAAAPWNAGTAVALASAIWTVGKNWRERRRVPADVEAAYRLLESWRPDRRSSPPASDTEEAAYVMRSGS
ncbi:MAG: glycosyltransferase [Planctomycetaceae bacterium]|nr:glycosyltransferase [Planctomycetaceae bacterium]